MRIMSHWRRELRSNTTNVLGSLGRDADELARRLAEAGVKGTPSDPRDCAIAVYLSAFVPADPKVRSIKVTADRVVISTARRLRPPVVIRLPEALRQFVARFDRHVYPLLVRTGPEKQLSKPAAPSDPRPV
jgi:hypothetical protein